jgi:hypothetical protein
MTHHGNNQIVVNAGERKHVGFGVNAIVKPHGTVILTKGGNVKLEKQATAFVLFGGEIEAQHDSLVFLTLRLDKFVQVPSNVILAGLDHRMYRAIYHYTD